MPVGARRPFFAKFSDRIKNRREVMYNDGKMNHWRALLDVGTDNGSNQVILVNGEREQKCSVAGQAGYPFFGQLILDCINRTENAMTQAHAFKAAELCLQAQAQAVVVSK